jgi:hypothetical protein
LGGSGCSSSSRTANESISGNFKMYNMIDLTLSEWWWRRRRRRRRRDMDGEQGHHIGTFYFFMPN